MIMMAWLRGALDHRCAIDRVLVLVRAITIVVPILIIILTASIDWTVISAWVSDYGCRATLANDGLLITSIIRLLEDLMLLMSTIYHIMRMNLLRILLILLFNVRRASIDDSLIIIGDVARLLGCRRLRWLVLIATRLILLMLLRC